MRHRFLRQAQGLKRFVADALAAGRSPPSSMPQVWNLAGAMAIKQLPMPPLGDKYAVKTFLDRQKVWTELREKYEECDEWLRPYSFRNSYSLRAHRIGHRNDVICMAMGHSLSTHESNYEWARSESVLEHI